jgi:glycine oxidase
MGNRTDDACVVPTDAMNPSPQSAPHGGTYDLIVLGAGIMGLSTAFEAMRRGRRVAVIDPQPFGGAPAQRASWAAAGILNTRAGLLGGSPFRSFHLRSVPLYPDWLQEIEAASGVKVPYERAGDYQIFLGDPAKDAETRRVLHEREDQLGRERASRFTRLHEWPEFLKPHGAPGPIRIYHFPDEAYVNNRALLEALEAALRRGGAGLFPGARVDKASREDGANVLTGAGLPAGGLRANRILIAAGTWCNEPLALFGLSMPLFPVKGQLALLPNFHGQRTMLHGGERFYLVPRGDMLIAGATTEPRVWEDGFDAKGEAHLGAELSRFFPAVRPPSFDAVETWSGLRPRSADRLPLLGWVDAASGIALATGLYKSGISLAPLASRSLAALLEGGKPAVDLRPFDPWRAGGLQVL